MPAAIVTPQQKAQPQAWSWAAEDSDKAKSAAVDARTRQAPAEKKSKEQLWDLFQRKQKAEWEHFSKSHGS